MTQIDEYLSNLCRNNATYIDRISEYYCQYTKSFSWLNCENKVNISSIENERFSIYKGKLRRVMMAWFQSENKNSFLRLLVHNRSCYLVLKVIKIHFYIRNSSYPQNWFQKWEGALKTYQLFIDCKRSVWHLDDRTFTVFNSNGYFTVSNFHSELQRYKNIVIIPCFLS